MTTNLFINPQMKLCIHETLNTHLPSPQPLATTILLSVSVGLTTLETSYKWNHTVFVLLCMAYFT